MSSTVAGGENPRRPPRADGSPPPPVDLGASASPMSSPPSRATGDVVSGKGILAETDGENPRRPPAADLGASSTSSAPSAMSPPGRGVLAAGHLVRACGSASSTWSAPSAMSPPGRGVLAAGNLGSHEESSPRLSTSSPGTTRTRKPRRREPPVLRLRSLLPPSAASFSPSSSSAGGGSSAGCSSAPQLAISSTGRGLGRPVCSTFAASSSPSQQQSARTSAGPFPCAMEGKTICFRCRSVPYRALVSDVRAKGSVVELRTSEPVPKRPFADGETVTLHAPDGSCWSGSVKKEDGDHSDSLYTRLLVDIPVPAQEPDSGSVLEENFMIDVFPTKTIIATPAPVNAWKKLRMVPQEEGHERHKSRIGLKGFEKLGRAVAEVLIESSDVNLVAIYTEEINVTNLVRSWKNNNIPLRVKDYRTVLFKRTYQRENKPPEEEEIEVTLFFASQLENIPWSEAGVEYVVDSVAVMMGEQDTREPKVINDKKLVHCLTRFPKVSETFGLLFDRQKPRFMRPSCTLTIVATSISSLKALMDSFPQWDGRETSMSFFADGSAHETSSFDLIVTLSTSSSNSKKLGNGTTTSDSFTALLRTCIDMILPVPLPIVRCRLELF